MTPTFDPPNAPSNRELIDNLYDWLYIVLNRLDRIENPGVDLRWPEPSVRGDDE